MNTSIYTAANTDGDVEAHVFEYGGGFDVRILDNDAGEWFQLDGCHFPNLPMAQAYADRCVR